VAPSLDCLSAADGTLGQLRPFSGVDRPGVEVAVLGPVSVRGTMQPFHRAASLDLVVYLAFHRRRVSHADWASALWPDRPVSAATVHSTASDARRALGRSAGGALLLPRGTRLLLHHSVTTDVDRFSELLRRGDLDSLLAAFRLVRGPVFTGLRRLDWTVFEGTRAGVEAMVADAALVGADALVGGARAAAAEWVVRRGLLVSPFDERLYRALLRVTAARANRVGLRAAMEDLLTLAGAEPAARPALATRLSCLDPETAALYRGLLDGTPAAGGLPARL
jgi:DNA-binding SARP family transcriptional activator